MRVPIQTLVESAKLVAYGRFKAHFLAPLGGRMGHVEVHNIEVLPGDGPHPMIGFRKDTKAIWNGPLPVPSDAHLSRVPLEVELQWVVDQEGRVLAVLGGDEVYMGLLAWRELPHKIIPAPTAYPPIGGWGEGVWGS